MGSIVVERAFDILMLICLMLLLFFFLPETHFLGGTVLTTGVIFFALVAGIFAYRFRVDETHRVIDKVLRVLPQRLEKFVARQFKSFLQGIRGVSTVAGYLEVIVCTVLIWALETSAVALVVISFGVTLPLSGYLLLQALAALSTALPSGPAYIGPYQYAFVIALGFFAISTETALAISIVAQFALLGSITVIGLVLLWREQLRAGPLARRKKLEPRGGKVG